MRAEPGTVLFKPTICKGATCDGLDKTEVKCRRKSRLLRSILIPELSVHGLILTKKFARLKEQSVSESQTEEERRPKTFSVCRSS